jgi:hypothetical protein
LGIAQASAHLDSADGLTDRQTLHAVLSIPENRYLGPATLLGDDIEGLETYILVPRDPMDLQRLVEAVRPLSRAEDLDVVIGVFDQIDEKSFCRVDVTKEFPLLVTSLSPWIDRS